MPMSPRLLRPLASGWTPRQLPDLGLWLDASDAATVTVATGVSEWRDKSGRGLHASQATAGSQPAYSDTQNGRKVVTFDGSDDHLAGSAPFSTLPVFGMGVLFFPSRKDIGVVYEQFTGATDNVAFYRGHSSTDGFRIFNGTNLSSAALPANNQWHLMGFLAGTTSANSRLYYNGTVDVTGNAGTATPQTGGYYLARWAGAGASPAYTPMRMGEWIGLNREPTTTQRQKIEGYLAWKWGLQAQLPSNHPYAYSFPGFGSQARPDNGDALAWESAVYANSGSVSVGTLAAVNTFANAIDAAGIRDRFYRLSLMCGDSDVSLVAVRTPLYRGPSLGGTQYGNALDTNNNFVQGDYAETGATGGLKGNGSSKYLDTGLQSDALPVPGVGHLSAWGRDQTTGRSGWLSSFGASFTNQTQIEYNQSDGNTFFGWGREQTILTTPGTVSHLLVSRGSSTDQRAYHDGSLAGTNTVSTSMSGNSAALTVLARNVDGSLGAYSDGRINSYSIGDNMSGTQVTAFYNALNTFLTTLGRT